jgi:hypothetical protein
MTPPDRQGLPEGHSLRLDLDIFAQHLWPRLATAEVAVTIYRDEFGAVPLVSRGSVHRVLDERRHPARCGITNPDRGQALWRQERKRPPPEIVAQISWLHLAANDIPLLEFVADFVPTKEAAPQ